MNLNTQTQAIAITVSSLSRAYLKNGEVWLMLKGENAETPVVQLANLRGRSLTE
jgi:hypothetical protein